MVIGQQDLSLWKYAMCATNGAALASTTSITISGFASSQNNYASANATCYWEVIEYV